MKTRAKNSLLKKARAVLDRRLRRSICAVGKRLLEQARSEEIDAEQIEKAYIELTIPRALGGVLGWSALHAFGKPLKARIRRGSRP